jgi:hypothetical protein
MAIEQSYQVHKPRPDLKEYIDAAFPNYDENVKAWKLIGWLNDNVSGFHGLVYKPEGPPVIIH